MKSDRDLIDQYFRDGMRAGEDFTVRPDQCPPHGEHSIAAQWWTRGFAYQARLLRAIHAESLNVQLLDACREALLWYGPDGDHIGDPARPLLIAAIAKAEGRS